MKTEKVKLAIIEAKRFLERANKLVEARKTQQLYVYDGITHYYDSHAPKESGAVRRASMDLTRCLADMRKAD